MNFRLQFLEDGFRCDLIAVGASIDAISNAFDKSVADAPCGNVVSLMARMRFALRDAGLPLIPALESKRRIDAIFSIFWSDEEEAFVIQADEKAARNPAPKPAPRSMLRLISA
jgi:hypothetical protein